MSQPSVVVRVSGIISLVIGVLLCGLWGILLIGYLSSGTSEVVVHDEMVTLRALIETVGLGVLGAAMLVTGWALVTGKPWARMMANISGGMLAVLAPLYMVVVLTSSATLAKAWAETEMGVAVSGSLMSAAQQSTLVAGVVGVYAVALLVAVNRPAVKKHFQLRFYGLV